MLWPVRNKNNGGRGRNTKQPSVLPLITVTRGIDYLVEMIKKIRPADPGDSEQATLKFKALLYQLTQDKSSLFSLRKALLSQFVNTKIVNALSESGILSSRGFVQEFLGKLKHKILPALLKEDDFLFGLNKVFYKKTDYIWVEGLDKELWIEFFQFLGIQINLSEPLLINQLHQGLQVLSYRITTLGLEKEMTHRFEHFEDAVYPFLEQNRLVNEFLHLARSGTNTEAQQLILKNISEALHNCNQSIRWIKQQRTKYGTSLAQTFILTRLEQQINRLFIIIDVLDTDNSFDTERFVEYFQTVIHNENMKNSIREFVSENTGYLAYQIAEHGGRTGEKYITTTHKEFWQMFWSAAGGGVIISFIGVIKNLLSRLVLAPFWQCFLYSVNYSLGFILIQDTGSTLATKQPAYTANNLASSLDVQKVGEEPDLRNLAITVARVSRTQLASFAGNLLVVFPLTFILALVFFEVTGTKIAYGAAAHKLLTDQQPFQTLSWLYACITGFFLFASGIIAGYVENYVVYGKITERLQNSASFRNSFTKKRQAGILNYVENNFGALIGNISLGFFLGMAGFIGKIFGIPFDIRHITISAANVAIGFFGMAGSIGWKEIGYTIFGVLSIGFLNFAVSFGLAFIVAVKSRGIHLRNYPEFMGIFWRYLKKYPRDFIKAPRLRLAEELR